jgi:hypothetical protein
MVKSMVKSMVHPLLLLVDLDLLFLDDVACLVEELDREVLVGDASRVEQITHSLLMFLLAEVDFLLVIRQRDVHGVVYSDSLFVSFV